MLVVRVVVSPVIVVVVVVVQPGSPGVHGVVIVVEVVGGAVEVVAVEEVPVPAEAVPKPKLAIVTTSGTTKKPVTNTVADTRSDNRNLSFTILFYHIWFSEAGVA